MTSRTVDIVHPDGTWSAHHDAARADGPLAIRSAGEPLVRDVGWYVDELPAETMLLDRFQAFRKGGCAMVQTRGHYPFGAEVGMTQRCRYAANHVRVTNDLRWRSGARIERHVGVGGLFLPGEWRRYYCVPPCLHLSEGKPCTWVEIPSSVSGSGMIGHWHRPPLALVFERADGSRVEVSTGDDVWRWEENFGFGPEAGSYKIMSVEGGLRVVREPLMTCTEVDPRPRDYRFTWTLSWKTMLSSPAEAFPPPVPIILDQRRRLRPLPAGDGPPSLVLDLNSLPWPEAACRQATPADAIRGKRLATPCWHSRATQKLARHIIRRLSTLEPAGWLTVRGVEPGPCWDASHVDRPGDPLPHWDAGALLDFAVWTRQQLGPEWHIRAEVAEPWKPLPSLEALFANNGFRVDSHTETDDDI